MNRRVLALLLASIACRPPATAPPVPTTPGTNPPTDTATDPVAFERPVVVSEHPLSLSNPQQEVSLWPVWGGASSLAEPVALRASMQAGAEGASGLVLAGPGAARERVAVELVSVEGAWMLRETDGGNPVQEVALDGPVEGLVVEIASDRVTAGEAALDLQGSLGDEVGMYVTLDPGGSLSIDEISLGSALPSHPELGQPLRDLADARGVAIGSATDIWPPVHDAGFDALFGEQFGAASPTEFYWPTTRGEDGDFYFIPADLMVNYALVHDQAVTGMFLVWDFSLPRWVIDLARDQGSAALGTLYDEHITTLVTRYRGQVDHWIVVNEAIWGPGDAGNPRAKYAETLWYDYLGAEEHIERAFVVARAADPDAVLLYNETGAEELNGKSDFMYEMASDFVSRGVPLDGIGLQFHIDAAAPPDMDSVRANFERFAALGLDLYITELDVSLATLDLPEADEQELQATIYADVLETCLAVPACRSATVFGFCDRYAWDELGDATPLLFDEDYAAKPAFYALQSVLE